MFKFSVAETASRKITLLNAPSLSHNCPQNFSRVVWPATGGGGGSARLPWSICLDRFVRAEIYGKGSLGLTTFVVKHTTWRPAMGFDMGSQIC